MEWLIPLGILAAVILYAVGLYNGLVRLRQQVMNAWSQIDVQLKRRHDLIPNLLETVKGYMTHERETFEEITKARSQAAGANTVGEKSEAETRLSGALGRFFLVVENYPDLKANQNFLALQEELTTTENKIGFARQFYNDQAMRLNTRIQTVPANVIANLFGFKEAEFFEIEMPDERKVPEIKF